MSINIMFEGWCPYIIAIWSIFYLRLVLSKSNSLHYIPPKLMFFNVCTIPLGPFITILFYYSDHCYYCFISNNIVALLISVRLFLISISLFSLFTPFVSLLSWSWQSSLESWPVRTSLSYATYQRIWVPCLPWFRSCAPSDLFTRSGDRELGSHGLETPFPTSEDSVLASFAFCQAFSWASTPSWVLPEASWLQTDKKKRKRARSSMVGALWKITAI